MDDLIDRQAAIDAMLKLQAEDEEAYGCSIPECFDGERAKEALEQLPSIPTVPKDQLIKEMTEKYNEGLVKAISKKIFSLRSYNMDDKGKGEENE